MTRLASINAGLQNHLASLNAESQVLVARTIAAWAVEQLFTDADLPSDLRTSGTVEVNDESLSRRWALFSEQLDEIYFESWDGSDVVPPEFYRARAAYSMSCAFESNPEEAVSEAVYEAIIATDQPAEIERMCRSIGF